MRNHTSFQRTGALLSLSAALVLATAACGSSKKSSSSSSSPSTAAASTAADSSPTADASSDTSAAASTDSAPAVDPGTLLITTDDIPVDGIAITTPAAPISQSGVTGASIAFGTADGTRTLGDTVLVFPSADAAKTALKGSEDAAAGTVPGVDPTDLSLGDGGQIYSGNKKGGGKVTTIGVWQEGTAVIVLEFDADLGDAVPDDVASQIATAQDTKVKTALGG